MRREKIYFIHHFMHPGGVERQLYPLVNGLAGYHDVTLLLCEMKGAFIEFIDKSVAIISLNTPYKYRLQFGLLVGMLKILKQDRPDVLISFHGSFHWIAVLVGRILGIRVVCVFPGYMIAGLLWAAHRLMFNLADGLIVVSQGVRTSMIKNLRIRADKIAVIENAIDVDKICHLSEEVLSPAEQQYFDNRAVIISIGRLAKGKGFEVILNALSIIRKEVSLLIIGDGPEKHNLENQISKLGLSDKVFLLGSQINPYKFLKYANFFVLASESEGLPTVILEAMCLGVPCICTNYRGGAGGLIQHEKNGYLFKPNDVEGLASAIDLFLNPASGAMLASFEVAGKNMIREKYTLEKYVGRYQHYLDGLCKGKCYG